MRKRVLFIDRDGTIIKEPPQDYQVDKIEKFSFIEGAILSLNKIRKYTDFVFVMVTNQDGLGTESFPEKDFWPYQNLMLDTLKSAGVEFDEIYIDRSFESENLPTRKPGIKMLEKFLNEDEYNLAESFVIGDRPTDVMLAKNIGCKAVYFGKEIPDEIEWWCALKAENWTQAERFLISSNNIIKVMRRTNETKVYINIYPGNPEIKRINTGLNFFNHMLSQIPVHGCFGMEIDCIGDLEVDQHHTIEDVGIALGMAVEELWRKRKLINRYAFVLPMDDCLAQVAMDLGGRPWMIWNVVFNREMIGDFPTEMAMHFFKSFSDNAKCNLNIKAEGYNEHHKLEGIFKAFAKCLKQAISYDFSLQTVPSSKGSL